MIASAKQYHFKTSYDRYKMTGHGLDWANQPDVYKLYPGIAPIDLPRDIDLPQVKLSELLNKRISKDCRLPSLSKADISRIFLLTYCLTATARHGGSEFYYRSVASAGALYPAEMYVFLKNVTGLDDGLYHFSIACHGLSLLRRGDPSTSLKKTPGPNEMHGATAAFFFSGIFFRSAWKYRERAYRYHLLDTGHLIEHLILTLKALDLPYTLFFDFDDDRTNQFLGFEEAKEVCLAFCCVPDALHFITEGKVIIKELPDRIKAASRVSGKEIDYPAIREIHQASKKVIKESLSAFSMADQLGIIPQQQGDAWTTITSRAGWPETLSFAESVLARRSKRNFIKRPLPEGCAIALLESLCATDPKRTTLPENSDHSLCIGFIVENVQGFDSGFYLLDPFSASFTMIKPGHFMAQMSRICLDQAWLANASVHVMFMTDLNHLDLIWGPRGYRYAMMIAGRMGERIYLAATAMGIGCCGIGAFYDLEASRLLGLNDNARLLYLVSAGPIKR